MDNQLQKNERDEQINLVSTKKSVPYISILALLISLVAVGFVILQFNKIGELKEELANGKVVDSISPGQVKVAYVNLDSINAKYKFIIEKGEELKANFEDADKKLQTEIATRQKEADELMYYMKNGHPTAEDKKVSEQRLMQLQNELAQIQQSEEQRLMESESALQSELHKRVSDYISKISKEQGWDYVFAYQEAAPLVMFGNPLYDLTNQIIEGLNSEYNNSLNK
jgi:outer membrane protein